MKRFIVTAVAFLFVAPLFAQSRSASDVGVYVVGSSLSNTTITDSGGTVKFDFDEKTGYGVSFNHFWTDQLSTEFALQTINADLNLSSSDVPGVTVNAGELDAKSLTAMGQWHFLRAGRFSPYVGAGIAHVTGDFKFDPSLLDPGDDSKVDLESSTTWTASAGANIRLTDNLALGTELKYIPWKPVEKGGVAEDRIDVNPLTLAVGLRLRF